MAVPAALRLFPKTRGFLAKSTIANVMTFMGRRRPNPWSTDTNCCVKWSGPTMGRYVVTYDAAVGLAQQWFG